EGALASLCVGCFEIDRQAEGAAEAQRQGGQRAAERQGNGPQVELVRVLAVNGTVSDGIEISEARWPFQAEQAEDFVVQLRSPSRHDVDHDETDAPVQIGNTFGSEGSPVLRAVLVGGADELDDGHQLLAAAEAEDLNLDVVREDDG